MKNLQIVLAVAGILLLAGVAFLAILMWQDAIDNPFPPYQPPTAFVVEAIPSGLTPNPLLDPNVAHVSYFIGATNYLPQYWSGKIVQDNMARITYDDGDIKFYIEMQCTIENHWCKVYAGDTLIAEGQSTVYRIRLRISREDNGYQQEFLWHWVGQGWNFYVLP